LKNRKKERKTAWRKSPLKLASSTTKTRRKKGVRAHSSGQGVCHEEGSARASPSLRGGGGLE